MRAELRDRISPLIRGLYPDAHAAVTERLLDLAVAYRRSLAGRRVPAPSHRTACLITYGDGVTRAGESGLRTLAGFLADQVGDLISDVHLLPMFPWTSDDGFAVVDHRQVNPALGTWSDVGALTETYAVMFDFVANHTSTASAWFEGWLAGDPAYEGFYLAEDPGFDIGQVVRPRTTPLFHSFTRPDGSPVRAWTTFGPDQADVDVREPRVLLELTDVLLGYLQRGASAVRLDAIGFLWKESGTRCIHLPRTHAVIKLWRALVEYVLPGARLITETNVPHAENAGYFGNGEDEANMVYQFALPPLVLHSFVSSSTARLSAWAAGIGPVSRTATWFNFLASHDGIGLRATEGILDDGERDALVERTLAHGGEVSWASRPDGSRSVYELNLGYLDALCTLQEAADAEVLAAKALCAHSILLAFLGVPALYLHSLVGSPSDHDGMAASGISRRINREVLDADRLVVELALDERRHAVFNGILRLLAVRREQPAFSPFGTQCVELLDERVFAIRRGAGTAEELLCVSNVSGEQVSLPQVSGTDVITGDRTPGLVLGPWQYVWLRLD